MDYAKTGDITQVISADIHPHHRGWNETGRKLRTSCKPLPTWDQSFTMSWVTRRRLLGLDWISFDAAAVEPELEAT